MPHSQNVYFSQECKVRGGLYDRTYLGKVRQGKERDIHG